MCHSLAVRIIMENVCVDLLPCVSCQRNRDFIREYTVQIFHIYEHEHHEMLGDGTITKTIPGTRKIHFVSQPAETSFLFPEGCRQNDAYIGGRIMIRAVFFDIDGTLYSHSAGQIYPSTLAAVRSLQENGILTVICTGRHLLEMKELPVLSQPFDGYITLNGQICLDEKFEVYDSHPIVGEDKDRLISVFNEKKIPLMLVEKDRLYINCFNEMIARTQDAIGTPVPEIREYDGADIFLACAFLMPEDQKLLMARFCSLKAVNWHPYGIDILPENSGKMAGIKAFLKKYGISREETMAFGDAQNDIDMISFAGIGVAMGNAPENVCAAADYVTEDVDHDGIVRALVHFGLLKEKTAE